MTVADERRHLTVVRPDGEAREVDVSAVDAAAAALEALFGAVKRAADRDDAATAVGLAQAISLIAGNTDDL